MYPNAFNGDDLLLARFAELVKEFDIKTIVETGTFEGKTTDALASLVPQVHTIEVNKNYQAKAKQNCKNKNITFHLGSSVDVLPKIIGKLNNPLFFLDAHWQKYCPLWDEIRIIGEAGLKPVIIIHDFKVPGKGGFGFDKWNGKDISHANVKAAIDKVYGPNGYTHSTNTQAHGAMRGAGFYLPILPKSELEKETK